MKDEIQGKIARIDEGETVLISVQRDKPIITVRGQTTNINTAALICVRPELFDEIKKAVGDPVGKRFFTKDGNAYIKDQKTTVRLSNLDFVVFPNK